MSETLRSIRLHATPISLDFRFSWSRESMLHFYDTHFSGSAFCLLHNIWQAAPRQGGQEAGTRMRQAARSVGVSAAKGFIFYFFFSFFCWVKGTSHYQSDTKAHYALPICCCYCQLWHRSRAQNEVS